MSGPFLLCVGQINFILIAEYYSTQLFFASRIYLGLIHSDMNNIFVSLRIIRSVNRRNWFIPMVIVSALPSKNWSETDMLIGHSGTGRFRYDPAVMSLFISS